MYILEVIQKMPYKLLDSIIKSLIILYLSIRFMGYVIQFYNINNMEMIKQIIITVFKMKIVYHCHIIFYFK